MKKILLAALVLSMNNCAVGTLMVPDTDTGAREVASAYPYGWKEDPSWPYI